MNYTENKNLMDNETNLSLSTIVDKVVKINFFMYLFFVFFGTEIPFQGTITQVDDMVSSNPFRQLIFSLIYLIASIGLVFHWKKALALVWKEKFLFLFFGWCLLSTLWSAYPTVTFKRWIQIVGPALVILSLFFCSKDDTNLLKQFRAILYLYIPLSYFAIIFIPQATAPGYDYAAWAGFAYGKNQLGQVSLISAIIWFYSFSITKTKVRYLHFFYGILSVVLLIGSHSATAIVAGMLVVLIAIVSLIRKELDKVQVGSIGIPLLIIMTLLSIAIIMVIDSSFFNIIFDMLGRDSSFSDRTSLWTSIWTIAKTHILFGGGYAAFWVLDNPEVLYLYNEFVWLPVQAHMGYLDLINEIGIIGVVLFVLMLLNYFAHLIYHKKASLWTLFIVLTLVINMQESTLFRLNSLTGIMFTMAYLILFNSIKNDIRNNLEGDVV